jgi:hypothetical protein
VNFLTHWSVESINAAHTKIQSESKNQYQENENQHFAALSTDKQKNITQRITNDHVSAAKGAQLVKTATNRD